VTVAEVRRIVASREIGCIAPRIDAGAGPCRDRWGGEMPNAPRFLSLADGEMDYVRRGAIGRRHELPEDHAWLCHQHHVGTAAGRNWATSHREAMRAYLDGLAVPA